MGEKEVGERGVKDSLLFLIMWAYVCEGVCAQQGMCPWRSLVSTPLELRLQVIVIGLTWVLGSELGTQQEQYVLLKTIDLLLSSPRNE